MFPDTDHIFDMQTELDNIIQLGIVSLNRLLKNAENASKLRDLNKGESDESDDTDDEVSTDVEEDDFGTSVDDKDSDSGQLLEKLIKSGVLTKAMLRQLQRELTQKPANPSHTKPRSRRR